MCSHVRIDLEERKIINLIGLEGEVYVVHFKRFGGERE